MIQDIQQPITNLLYEFDNDLNLIRIDKNKLRIYFLEKPILDIKYVKKNNKYILTDYLDNSVISTESTIIDDIENQLISLNYLEESEMEKLNENRGIKMRRTRLDEDLLDIDFEEFDSIVATQSFQDGEVIEQRVEANRFENSLRNSFDLDFEPENSDDFYHGIDPSIADTINNDDLEIDDADIDSSFLDDEDDGYLNQEEIGIDEDDDEDDEEDDEDVEIDDEDDDLDESYTPCDGDDGYCPYDAEYSSDCYNYCGLGADEDEPSIPELELDESADIEGDEPDEEMTESKHNKSKSLMSIYESKLSKRNKIVESLLTDNVVEEIERTLKSTLDAHNIAPAQRITILGIILDRMLHASDSDIIAPDYLQDIIYDLVDDKDVANMVKKAIETSLSGKDEPQSFTDEVETTIQTDKGSETVTSKKGN